MSDVVQREEHATTLFPGLEKGTQGTGMGVHTWALALGEDVCDYATIRVCWVAALHTGEI